MPTRPARHKTHHATTPTHEVPEQERLNSYQRGYTKQWAKARADYLAEFPHCAECLKRGKRTVARVVDHIIPHRGDSQLFWSRDNWQSLCIPDHNAKSAREGGNGWSSRGRAG